MVSHASQSDLASMTNIEEGRIEPGAQGGAAGIECACASRRVLPCASVAARRFAALLCFAVALLVAAPAWAAGTFNWETNRNRVTADIKSGKLIPLLEQIASVTGWRVFVEPDTGHSVSAKFSNLRPGRGAASVAGRSELRFGSRNQRQPEAVCFPHHDEERDAARRACQCRGVSRRRQGDSQRADCPAQAGGED